MTTTKIIFKARDSISGKYIHNYYSLRTVGGKEFKSEDAARTAISGYISYNTSTRGKMDPKDFADKLKWKFEVVKFEIIQKEVAISSTENFTKNVLLSQQLYSDLGYKYHYFWEQAMRKNYADSINYVFLLEQKPGQVYMDMIKSARESLRNLGVKTRTFREFNGCFGFYNKDQALKARLTLDAKSFIDIEELRQKMFG